MNNSRRRFLKKSAVAAGVSLSWPTAFAQETPGHAAPVIGPPGGLLSTLPSLSATGLKIQKIETFTRGYLSIVRITADDGAQGYGQIAPYDADISAMILHRKIAGHWLGKDPAALADITDRCIEANYKFPWSYVCRALTGVETAAWDLLGRRAAKPVYELLGGKSRPLPVYGSSMSRTITPEEEADRLLKIRQDRGFGAFKIRVGKQTGRDEDQWPGRTEALVSRVRKTLGDEVVLLADANSCYSPPQAVKVGRLLEDHGFGFFEEPCPYWELEWTAAVTKTLRMPVAGGEQDNDLAQFRRMIQMRAVDIVQPDICYIGGVARTLQVGRWAADAQMICIPHSANLSLVTVFTLHTFASMPNAGDYLEYSIENDAWTRDLYEPELEVKDGRVTIPEGPGWGVQVKASWLEQAERQASTLT
jgi:L-alanine-DL-glutamate epimerase-like enolase superfamily enzyme